MCSVFEKILRFLWTLHDGLQCMLIDVFLPENGAGGIERERLKRDFLGRREGSGKKLGDFFCRLADSSYLCGSKT